MNLEFTKEGAKWVALAEVSGDFNLHVEKGAGILAVSQSGVSGGEYAIVESLRMAHNEDVVDTDVAALVYPKYLRFEAYTQEAPTVVITYNA